ncbi:MAG: undecaprenyldiphospho-muramoylpentapeptide beta-N-acetylglucosaminyltransferase [Chitinophagales bacterium]|nr:undecaprenyldiphospho-muramoylpentapeptide beta-N-acetylglucosaminyltransferase [Chitinophagales bacterium]
MEKHKKYRVILSGGGTAGHIFPALAIADALKEGGIAEDILFVGALGRMEMEKVPTAGYPIEGLEIAGLQRSSILKNLKLPFKLLKSLKRAGEIIDKFQPDIAIGVGGYASGSLLLMANRKKIPTLIQEQNSYPGITNKFLAKRAKKICVAYPEMEQFFAQEKIVYTGNPVRSLILKDLPSKEESCAFFGLGVEKPVVLSFGGSLGAKTINESINKSIETFSQNDLQVIWQTGKAYYENIIKNWEGRLPQGIQIHEFLKEMHYAYGAADVIIARAGALSISELCIVGKPAILIPSPNVAEDHQTKNAMALVNKGAAILVKDSEATEQLCNKVLGLIQNKELQYDLSKNIKTLAKSNATEQIVKTIQTILTTR